MGILEQSELQDLNIATPQKIVKIKWPTLQSVDQTYHNLSQVLNQNPSLERNNEGSHQLTEPNIPTPKSGPPITVPDLHQAILNLPGRQIGK